MTYNFDPDRWYENERAVLETGYKEGEMSTEEYEAAVADLDRRYGEMLDRLNGTTFYAF
jgi:hypothetical protein